MMRPARFPVRTCCLTATILLVAAAASADRVRLTNGRTFEEVIATLDGDEIEIRLPYGIIRLPVALVERVERGDDDFAEYTRRARSLRADPGATGASWLELAEWALAAGLEQSTREAALTAAEIAPGLEGLPRLMRRFGYALDPALDRWLPADRLAPRPEERARSSAPEEKPGRGSSEVETRLARAVEMMALAELQRSVREPAGEPVYAPPAYYAVGSWWVPAHRPRLPAGPPTPEQLHGDIFRSQPGSLFGTRPRARAHRGAFRGPQFSGQRTNTPSAQTRSSE